jgi:uncharacterized protein (DUF2237 family)
MTKIKILGLLIFTLLTISSTFGDNLSMNKKNVLGSELHKCCDSPKTGYYRNGYCHTDPTDHGTHVVCAIVTKEFLEFTKSRGNDLSTPNPNNQFPGLVPGNRWCLCALRWLEAQSAGVAPKVELESTHQKALEFIDLETLKKFKASK